MNRIQKQQAKYTHIKDVFLKYSMHDNTYQSVEEDSKVILEARFIGEWNASRMLMTWFLASNIVMQRNEHIGQRTC